MFIIVCCLLACHSIYVCSPNAFDRWQNPCIPTWFQLNTKFAKISQSIWLSTISAINENVYIIRYRQWRLSPAEKQLADSAVEFDKLLRVMLRLPENLYIHYLNDFNIIMNKSQIIYDEGFRPTIPRDL